MPAIGLCVSNIDCFGDSCVWLVADADGADVAKVLVADEDGSQHAVASVSVNGYGLAYLVNGGRDVFVASLGIHSTLYLVDRESGDVEILGTLGDIGSSIGPSANRFLATIHTGGGRSGVFDFQRLNFVEVFRCRLLIAEQIEMSVARGEAVLTDNSGCVVKFKTDKLDSLDKNDLSHQRRTVDGGMSAKLESPRLFRDVEEARSWRLEPTGRRMHKVQDLCLQSSLLLSRPTADGSVVQVYSVEREKLLYTLDTGCDRVTDVRLLRGTDYVAVGCSDKKIRIWNVTTKELIGVIFCRRQEPREWNVGRNPLYHEDRFGPINLTWWEERGILVWTEAGQTEMAKLDLFGVAK